MAFSDFDLRTAVRTFGLQEERDTDLFPAVTPLEPSPFLRVWLDEFAPVALGMNTEKAKSEFIIAPMLVEAKRRSAGPVTVFPGVTFEADRNRGLVGFCDFLITRSKEFYYLQGPTAAVVEAKREDIIGGLGQCAAALVGLQVFNEREGTTVPAVSGCVTSGNVWRFLRLAGTVLHIDRREYYIQEAGTILGVLVQVMSGAPTAGV
jgi:hypothetical protein